MPRVLSKRNSVYYWVPTLAAIGAPTIAEITAGTDLTCHIVKGQWTLGPTASDTTDETDLCAEGKGAAITDGNYECNGQLFRYFTPLGAADTMDLKAAFLGYPQGFIVARHGMPVTTAIAAADEVEVFGFTADNPRTVSEDGSIKLQVTFVPTGEFKLDAAVAAA